MSTETVRLIRDGEKGVWGVANARITSALRWAAMRAILMFR